MACYGKLWHIFLKQLIIQEVTLLNILFLHISNPSKSITLSMQVLSLVQPPSSDSPAAFDVVLLASVCEVFSKKWRIIVTNRLFHFVSLAHPGFAVLNSSALGQSKVCRYKYHHRILAVWQRPSARRVFFF